MGESTLWDVGEPELWAVCDRIMPRFETIHHRLTPYQIAALCIYARRCGPRGAVVELGALCGGSTVALALGVSESSGHVVSIDTFAGTAESELDDRFEQDTLSEYDTNLYRAGLRHKVITLRGLFQDIAPHWRTPIAFLFIDGDHSYEAVKRDFDTWTPYVIPMGLVMLHDYNPNIEGSYRFANELQARGIWQPVAQVDTSMVFTRSSDEINGLHDRARRSGDSCADA